MDQGRAARIGRGPLESRAKARKAAGRRPAGRAAWVGGGSVVGRWRDVWKPEMAKELKALQKENARLKKLVADQALDMDILKEAAKGNW